MLGVAACAPASQFNKEAEEENFSNWVILLKGSPKSFAKDLHLDLTDRPLSDNLLWRRLEKDRFFTKHIEAPNNIKVLLVSTPEEAGSHSCGL